MKRTRTAAAVKARQRSVRVRKNGQNAIDAQSTMRLPMRLTRNSAFRWTPPGIAVFTPRYIEMILRGALSGDHIMQWDLFQYMLDTWPTLSACMTELMYDVIRRDLIFDPFTVEDETAKPSAIEREKVVTAAIDAMNPDATTDETGIDGLIENIMDAWFRGYSVSEILWTVTDTSQGTLSIPRAIVWVDPARYGFNQQGIMGLANQASSTAPTGYGVTSTSPTRTAQLQVFPPDQFLIAVHKSKSGSSLAGPLLRPLAWWWCAVNFASDWLMNFAQIFGLPFRWASYAASTPDQTVSAICDMLTNMGSAGWAAFPEGTSMELKEPGRGAEQTPQGHLLDRADMYARQVILGQTMTGQTLASGRGGQAFGTVEAQLKQDRIDAACRFVANVINQQLIPAILNRNYGDATQAPECRFLQEAEGTYQDAQRDQIINTMGVPIPISHLQQKYNIPEPTGDEAVSQAPGKPMPQSPVAPGPAGTRPIGQTPANPPPNPKESVQSRLEQIKSIEDDQIFAHELQKFAAELVRNKGENNDNSAQETCHA